MPPSERPLVAAGEWITRPNGERVARAMRDIRQGDKILAALGDWTRDFSRADLAMLTNEAPGERWISVSATSGLQIHVENRGWVPDAPRLERVRA